MDELEFYSKQYREFGRYDHGSELPKQLDLQHPEDYFEHLVRQHSAPNQVLVDLGCGDGRFTAKFAELNQRVIGIEPSALIDAARRHAHGDEFSNLSFLEENAKHLSLPSSSADLVISRRGPNPAQEIARILKVGGYFAFITIGEKDCYSLKEIVGRGQHFGSKTKVKDKLSVLFQGVGFEIVECSDYLYDECYSSTEYLIEFLHQVPIFDGFSQHDHGYIASYSKAVSGEQGIPLGRHRVVLLARLL